MSSQATTIDDPPAAPDDSPASSLAALRSEIDRIDDAIHDLLQDRARVVERVGRLGAKGRVALRPGREAAIVRRLVARHAGSLPSRAVARIWRELLAATTAMQGQFVVSVCETDPTDALLQLAHEHFGALTPMRVYRRPAQALAEISAGTASVAVLPMPAEEEASSAAWWTALLHRDDPRIHVVARLPFWASRAPGATNSRALVVAAIAPDPSGHDRSLIGVELPPEVSRARFVASLTTAGFQLAEMLVRRDPGAPVAHVLLEVGGMVRDGDPRLIALRGLARPPVVLGAYAVPMQGEGA